jgi:ABC-type sugar transport system substrate-binding protein
MPKSLVAVLTTLLCLVTTTCQRQTETTSSQPTVALVLKTLNNPFFIDMQKGGAGGGQAVCG